ncbi:MAG TPA: HNH endonuclease [Mycobacterium sp.]
MFIRVPLGERHLHPTIRNDGYIQRYQYVWNTHHPDDPVREGDVIHHINEDPADDRIENLEKTTQSKHAREHGIGREHTEESRALMSKAQLARRAREREERSRSVG